MMLLDGIDVLRLPPFVGDIDLHRLHDMENSMLPPFPVVLVAAGLRPRCMPDDTPIGIRQVGSGQQQGT
jgi:hypothetical protein